MKKRIDDCIIESIFGPAPCGVTTPLECRLSDGVEAYAKYARNPYGPRVLVNEWIGNSIADCFELDIPYYALAYFSDKAIAEGEQFGIRFDTTRIGFCSIKVPGLVPVSCNLVSMKTKANLAKIILFHCIVGEADSHEGNMLYDMKTDTVFILDSSHIFDKEIHKPAELLLQEYAGKLDVEKFYNANIDMYRMIGLEKKTDLAEELLYTARNFRKNLTNHDIKKIMADIPDNWKKMVGEEIIDVYEEILSYRINHVERIAQAIIVEGEL